MSSIVEDDFNALLDLLGPDTMRDVVKLLVESAPTRFASARDGLAAGDHARAATAFHTLRSSCGQLGAKSLEALCTEGERLSKHGDVPGAVGVLAAAEGEFARCLEWFGANRWVSAA